MGKRHFKGNNSSDDKKRRKETAEKWKSTRGDDGNDNRDNRSSGWNTVTVNARFEAFYKAQHFVNDGDDWSSFMEHLRLPLPACFRINPDYVFADELRKQLLGFVGKTLVVDNQEIKAVEQIGWYPNGYGYRLGTDRRSIRKLEALSQLHKWMVQHTENGNITRQEAVSMIPPLALNVSPNHKCLDMCAAPGSKTSQLLEIVNRSLSLPEDQQGLVVANDSDTDRAYMLVHQCKRINSPLLIVTTHKGQLFPSISDAAPVQTSSTATYAHAQPFFDRVLCDVPCSGDGTLRKNPTIWGKWATSMGTTLHPLQLMIAQRGLQLCKDDGLMVYSTCSLSPYENEAVVAELLRSSKGTLELVDARQFLPLFRARPGLSTWHVLDDFFAIKQELKEKRNQKNAAKGKVFSHSNDNTPEAEGAVNESKEDGEDAKEENDECAAVDELLAAEAHDGAATESKQVEEDSDKQDYSGITDEALLRCIAMGMTYYADHSKVPQHLDAKIRRSFFSPTAEEQEWMHLERCMRCVPQDEDTGGFFVATLRKIAKPPKAAKVNTAPVVVPEVVAAAGTTEESTAVAAVSVTTAKSSGAYNSQKGLVDFHQWDAEDFNKMKAFYGLDDTLPAESMFVREDFATTSKNARSNVKSMKSKSVYFIPHSARALMTGDKDERLKIVTAGVKMFERKDATNGGHDYRLLQEGISYIAPHVSNRKVKVTIQDFCNILGGGLVSFSTLSQSTINAVSLIQQGVLICIYDYDPKDVVVSAESESAAKAEADTGLETPKHSFYGICWKGGSRTLNVMCGKIDIESMKHQLEALNVLRPKINAVRVVDTTIGVPATAVAGGDEASAVVVEEVASESEVVMEV